jgi:uncharacterized membrane protein YphA (DoxX/SURF4 family)
MSYLIKTGRAFYSLALIVYSMMQFYFGDFRNVFFSPYQKGLPFLSILAWLFGIYLLISAGLVLVGKNGKKTASLLGAVFLMLFLGTHLTYELISEPNKIYHLGLWTNPLKELALAGGAFVVAGSFPDNKNEKGAWRFLSRLTPYGNLFFLFTMTAFGIGHLIYAEYLVKTVPAWLHDHLFWVYFSGTALVAAGVAIILDIRMKIVALLLAVMVFLWFWFIHIPGAISQPLANRAEYVVSAADALAFSGISLLIAVTMQKQRWISKIESHETNL